MSISDGLGRMWLRAPGAVQRALAVRCPVCGEAPGTACCVIDSKVPAVHDRRESIAYHMPKLHA
jgi:hypothetical protein